MSTPIKIVYKDGHEGVELVWTGQADQQQLEKFADHILAEMDKGACLFDIQEPKETP